MAMRVRHAEAIDGVAFEIELDHHDRFLADDPTVVPGVDGDDLRRLMFDDAAVGVLDVNLAAREEADVRVHTEVRPRHRLHVLLPMEARWIDHALDARRARAADVEAHMADVAVRRAADGREKRVGLTRTPSGLRRRSPRAAGGSPFGLW